MHLGELANLIGRLVGQKVSAKRIAGNSICIWFGVPPENSSAQGVWLEPPWRIERSASVHATSDNIPYRREGDESELEYRHRFEQACARSDVLELAELTDATVDVTTGDLTLHFSGGLVLRGFAISEDWEDWHYEDHSAGVKYRVLAAQVRCERSDA